MNLTPLINFFYLPADEIVWRLVFYYGWMIPAIMFLKGSLMVWLSWRRRLFFSKQHFTLLAIDIPRGNEQTPKALENMLAYLAGAHSNPNLIETYWEGKCQLGFSLEVVGIDGYIQFLVRTPDSFRNLVETAIYAQYPDAEIAEVEDYVDTVPDNFPNPDFDMWGAEFVPVAMNPPYKQALPIKTYKDFEYDYGRPEYHFKDPMASLMDLMSSLKPGEQIWYQILLIPTVADWPALGQEAINNILGNKPKSKETIIEKFFDGILNLISQIGDFVGGIFGLGGTSSQTSDKKEEKEDQFKMMNLLPIQKKQIEAIQDKVSKIGYLVKIRMIYVARREVMNKAKAVNGFVGFIKQFNTSDLNSLKPDSKVTQTSADYFNRLNIINSRKNKIMQAYKARDDSAGRSPWYLSVEEIATLWHFPIESVVKAPLLQKASSKKMEPPMALPTEETNEEEIELDQLFTLDSEDELTPAEPSENSKSKEVNTDERDNTFHQAPPPSNLPGI
ncbi:hypothetical protein KBI31_00095 [Patescibacteria group bacterium]|jgi:hypothetical protein|nr:hypothetical protein [Patescibacteria group bacterium]